ncbi:MAG TPA: cupredoxin domain-containing protein [Methylophilaceae bacterium]
MRKSYMVVIASLVLGLLTGTAVFADLSSTEAEQVIKVNAHKFEYVPNTLVLKKGVPVILEFTSSDVVMGFNSPDLKSRVTIIPGMVTRVRIVPENIGEFIFFCDIFCGDGHEDMTGVIRVVA